MNTIYSIIPVQIDSKLNKLLTEVEVLVYTKPLLHGVKQDRRIRNSMLYETIASRLTSVICIEQDFPKKQQTKWSI